MKKNKKILFISIVPPLPNDQGNRVVTLNVMDYFLERGYTMDAVFQCRCDRELFRGHFKDKVTLHEVGYIDFVRSFDFETRDKIKELLSSGRFDGYNQGIRDEIFCAANHFHPFEFINPDMVETARRLLEKNRYDLVVCNYIYCLRVVKELKHMLRGARTMVITIDAASRLDVQALHHGIDTSFKACSKETEAGCLNHADYVVAISKTEQEYFRRIGVTRPVILSEYNAFDGLKNLSVAEDNFKHKRLFFGASGNPLNRKGLEDFLVRCWPSIVARVPGAELEVVGKIGEFVPDYCKNVRVSGLVPYDSLMNRMSAATLSINPVYLGTGLKIKTVEAISLGLPGVSFHTGVDGLEELNNHAYLLADDWPDFADKCVELLTNYDGWNRLRRNSRQTGETRFSGAAVFEGFDKILEEMESNNVEGSQS